MACASILAFLICSCSVLPMMAQMMQPMVTSGIQPKSRLNRMMCVALSHFLARSPLQPRGGARRRPALSSQAIADPGRACLPVRAKRLLIPAIRSDMPGGEMLKFAKLSAALWGRLAERALHRGDASHAGRHAGGLDASAGCGDRAIAGSVSTPFLAVTIICEAAYEIP
jgi:hypothetical protein